MIKVINGSLYQWDLNRSVEVDDPENKISAIHFCHKGDEEALVVPFSKDEGKARANIPNILLQSSDEIYVFVVYTESEEVKTEEHKLLYIFARQKPSDYVYEESEVLSYKALEKELRKSLELKADLDEDGKLKKEQLPEDIIQEEEIMKAVDEALPKVEGIKPFVITLTADESGKYTSDKTGEEILVAFNAGRRLVCDVGSFRHIPLTRQTLFLSQRFFIFQTTYALAYRTVFIKLYPNSNDILSVSVTSGEYDEKKTGRLFINNQIYDGSENVFIDTREFVFNVTLVDKENDNFEIDVTAEAFLTAFNSGRTMIMVYEEQRIPFYQKIDENQYGFLCSPGGLFTLFGVVSVDGDSISASAEYLTGEITIGGQTAYGSEPVDFTDTINQMIEKKTISTEELASLKIALI